MLYGERFQVGFGLKIQFEESFAEIGGIFHDWNESYLRVVFILSWFV